MNNLLTVFFVFGLSRRSFAAPGPPAALEMAAAQRWPRCLRCWRSGQKKTMGKRWLQKFHGFRMFQTSISQLAGDFKYVWSSKIDRKKGWWSSGDKKPTRHFHQKMRMNRCESLMFDPYICGSWGNKTDDSQWLSPIFWCQTMDRSHK